jgi:tRNA-dihydrouridine synthase B
MDGVTDCAFRYITAQYGHPHVIFTEFTAVEGLQAGAERLLDDFYYDEIERPVVAQLFGAEPEAFFGGAMIVSALGFDGIDINMGCPAKSVVQRGAGAGLILDPSRAKEIIRQTRSGTQAWAAGLELEAAGVHPRLVRAVQMRQTKHGDPPRRELPVSVKTRTGYTEPVIDEWIPHLLEMEPANISLHGRTLKQLYAGEANWETIASAATLVHAAAIGCTLLGNGDVHDLADAYAKVNRYDVDGVLIGRAAFGDPWLFTGAIMSPEGRLGTVLELARYLDTALDSRGFTRIRKHVADFSKGHPRARELRVQLMQINTLADLEQLLSEF